MRTRYSGTTIAASRADTGPVIIDTSALVAILFGEPLASRLIDGIVGAEARRVGAPTVVETAAVMIARKGQAGELVLEALLARLDIEVVPFGAEAAARARSGYHRYGRGVGTPGVLNYGDCLSYGLAIAAGEPLLFVGDDFATTDVEVAAY